MLLISKKQENKITDDESWKLKTKLNDVKRKKQELASHRNCLELVKEFTSKGHNNLVDVGMCQILLNSLKVYDSEIKVQTDLATAYKLVEARKKELEYVEGLNALNKEDGVIGNKDNLEEVYRLRYINEQTGKGIAVANSGN